MASILAPWLTTATLICKKPAPVASIKPWLTTLTALISSEFPLTSFALITPPTWLVRISPLLPICPAPSIRLLTLTNAPAFALLRIGAPLLPF